MVFYYDAQVPTFKGLLKFSGTVFEEVLTLREYWLLVIFHGVCVYFCIEIIPEDAINSNEFRWEAASTMQFFMSFFVTFFNDICYARYLKILYPPCCDFVDAVVGFVEEMSVSMHHEELRPHCNACAKYLLAIVCEFFLAATGGKPTPDDWLALTRLGVLTSREATLLARYPGHQRHEVLACWVMLIVRDALRQDVLWLSVRHGRKIVASRDTLVWRGKRVVGGVNAGQELHVVGSPLKNGRVPISEPVVGEVDLAHCSSWRPKAIQVCHIYNRLNACMKSILKASHVIGFEIAMPLPFAYYHMMCATLFFNILLLAGVTALFRTYYTVPVFSAALLVMMGIKSVSASLIDPFGPEQIDLPTRAMVAKTYERVVLLLLPFTSSGVRSGVLHRLSKVEPFQEEDGHGLNHLDADVFREERRRSISQLAQQRHSWHADLVVQRIPAQIDVRNYYSQLLDPDGATLPNEEGDEDEEDEQAELKAAEGEVAQLVEELDKVTARGSAMEREIGDLYRELAELHVLEVGGHRDGQPSQQGYAI
eukprot:TRINITY_DN31436_c0_g1_i1.p1 TRINITY_DN31436_c0_g1~~TRINITY_DN31436_c0_g1_i1.p1  ORF type:complete len:537 (-),score=111.83 TRINITY_DN31436_c0_g1_i1:179-1789(-)